MSDPTLADLKAFVAVARRRSFQRAADDLGVSRSSLSHAVRGLEQRLGVRLLHRTTRSVSITEAGERFLQRIGPLLQALDAAVDTISHGADEVVGTLRINASTGAARWLLEHIVPAFLQRHPRVSLDLVSEGRLVDIVDEGFDAGVRLREAVPRDMIAVPFGRSLRFVAVAAPAYLAIFGQPGTPEDLHAHRCIRQRLPSGKRYRWEFARGRRDVAIDVPGALSLDNSDLMVDAALQGLGIAFVPEPFAHAALEDGRLVLLLEDWSPADAMLCLYYASWRHVPPPLRAFIDLLQETRGTSEDR